MFAAYGQLERHVEIPRAYVRICWLAERRCTTLIE